MTTGPGRRATNAAVALTGKQKRKLRALGHHLSPVVLVGGNGVTDGVVSATDQALHDHELIKVKFADEDRDSRAEAIESLAGQTGAEVAQVLGRTALLFKKRKKKSKINLDAPAAPAPKKKAATKSDEEE